VNEETNPPDAAPGAPPVPARAAAPGKSPLDLVLAERGRFDRLMMLLTRQANRRGLFGEDAKDAVGATFLQAFRRERTFAAEPKPDAVHWDPAKQDVSIYLLRILVDEI
jgi:hypothetical protein